MKKFLISLAAVLGISMAASAQSPEIQVGYGGYTQMDATNMHKGGGVKNAWGALTAGVNFKVAPKLWVGPSYSFSSSSYKHDGPNLYYHVIMLNARYEYWRNSIVTLYAHLGVGADITHVGTENGDHNDGYFAFQASPLGAQVGLSRNGIMDDRLSYEEKHELPDDVFGLPERREYPMPDAAHVRAAEAYFRYCPEDLKPRLAKAIMHRAAQYGVDVKSPTIEQYASM